MVSLLWIWTLLTALAVNCQKTVKFSRDFTPEHYNLRLEMIENKVDLTSFKGQVQIRMTCVADTTHITLHWRKLFIDNVVVGLFDTKKSPQPNVTTWETFKEQELLVISMQQALKKGSKYLLTIDFDTWLTPSGLHKTLFYGESGSDLRSLIVTRFYPNNARSIFPCFDEPDMKATFNLTLVYSEQYNVLSNLEPLEQTFTTLDSVECSVGSYYSEGPIAPYQLAFAVNDFDELEEFDESCPTILGYTDNRFSEIDNAINYTSSLLDFYNNLLGIDFPAGNLTLITTPAALLEYSGATGLLGVPYVVDDDSKKDHEHLLIHLARALMRQLLTGVMTLGSWSDLWIIEGLSWYFGQEAIESLFPGRSVSAMQEGCWDLYEVDALNRSVPLALEANGTTMIDVEELGQKSFCVMKTMSELIGERNFLNGVVSFVKKNVDKTVDRQSFVESFNSGEGPPGLTVKEFLNGWLTTAGMCVLNVTDTFISVRLPNVTIPPSGPKYVCRWTKIESVATKPRWVGCDLTYAIETTKKTDVIIQNGLFNYRVLYNPKTYDSIAELLSGSKANASKPHLLDDVLALAWTGYTNYSVALNLVNYLSREKEYLPWRVTLNHLEKLWFLLKGVARQEDMTNYMRSLIVPAYKALKVFTDDPKLSEDDRKLRSLIGKWACRLEWPDCTSSASKLFSDLDQVPKHLTEIVLRQFTRNHSDWARIKEVYKRTSSYDQLVQIIRALGSSPHMLPHVLELISEGTSSIVMGHHRRLMLESIVAETENPGWLFNSLLADFGRIDEPLRRYVMRKAAQRMVSGDDRALLELLRDRFVEQPDIGPLQDALLVVEDNLGWLKNRCEEFLVAARKFTVKVG